MKKLLTLVLGLAVMFSMTAFAQDASQNQPPMEKKSATAGTKTIKGTVKMEGDKLSFVADKDGKSWDVENPDALKGHEGHHVQVSAHVDADKNSIHVMDVKMLRASK